MRFPHPSWILRHRWLVATAAVLSVLAAAAPGSIAGVDEPIPSYYTQLQYNLTSPGARATSISGYANPAFYGMMPGSEGWFSWTDEEALTNWGLFLGGPHMGFGVVRSQIPLASGMLAGVNDYRLALSGGDKNSTVGLSYGWSGGDGDMVGRSRVIQVGVAERLGRYVSLGLVGNFATQKSYQSGFFDVAVRPLKTQLLTLYADYELPKGVSASDAPWSLGAMFDVGPGLQLAGRYFENQSWTLTVGYTLDALGFFGSPRFGKDDTHSHTVWAIRAGFPQADAVARHFQKDKTYLNMNLKGDVTYRGFRFFDKDRHQLSDVLADLEYAKNDPKIKGIALNLSGANMSRGKAWEIREKLIEVQNAGKHVIIFVDTIEMTEYHLASVADIVVLDPEGMVFLPGYVMGRTFVKDMLAKIGIGFDEWRFFKYKSAAEALSRDSMSDADREQRLAIIEDVYETVRAEVTSSRGQDAGTFDEWVDEEVVFNAKKALDLGLVDELGRWDDIKDMIEKLEGEKKRYVGRDDLAGNRYPSMLWGEDPKIAVVYALGECSMDTGINARKLEKVFNALTKNNEVKAVVFRVDSPGGDGMASDVVAEALRKCAEKKPVIVSQGDVAASGGYWISMYGTEIYALPTTITASIGVIGGWVWDDGVGEKIGHTSDHVQVGKHADLGYGIRLLLGGPMLPKRNLTGEERDRIEKEIRGFYDEFVKKVAKGRKMSTDEIHELAQGHVYSGTRGKELGLVDEIGGLSDAIHAARRAAGIPDDEHVTIVELPKSPSINPRIFSSGGPLRMLGIFAGVPVPGDEAGNEDEEFQLHPEWTYLRALVNNPGGPLYMLPPESYIYEGGLGR